MLSSNELPNCRCKSGWKARCITAYIDMTFYFFRFIQQKKYSICIQAHHGCNLSLDVGKRWNRAVRLAGTWQLNMTFNIFQLYDCALRSAPRCFSWQWECTWAALTSEIWMQLTCLLAIVYGHTYSVSTRQSCPKALICRHFYSVYRKDAVLQHLFCPAEYTVCLRDVLWNMAQPAARDRDWSVL